EGITSRDVLKAHGKQEGLGFEQTETRKDLPKLLRKLRAGLLWVSVQGSCKTRDRGARAQGVYKRHRFLPQQLHLTDFRQELVQFVDKRLESNVPRRTFNKAF